ncbi:MAG: Unknown protein [uncultured Thiotrichaceae bacterium]|uniref:histidine kinase n=1 Tax=uncultured Thiotrichaceae bacterium TaxID=298394 RepID=A0A6S6SU90_9GAMM|nr:MAG: Unknown protein [uncultured Thiotrichaceae bacterium]
METKSSIKKQFNIILLTLYVLSLLITLPFIYYLSSKDVYESANKELILLVDMVSAMRKTISKDIRPELLRQEVVHPAAALSSTVFTRHTAQHFKKLQPDYYIKIASDNPLNADNSPLQLEQEILNYFRANRDEKKLVRKGSINGKQFLLSSSPSIAKPNCNICHLSPEKAPDYIAETYGKKSGYNYKMGDVVGASFVGVPLDDINNIAIQRGLSLAGVLTGLFTFALILINYLLKKKVFNPITEIAESTYAISNGAYDRVVNTEGDTEIAELAQSIERIRVSHKDILNKH